MANRVYDGNVENRPKFAEKRVGQDCSNDRRKIAHGHKGMVDHRGCGFWKVQEVFQVNRQNGWKKRERKRNETQKIGAAT